MRVSQFLLDQQTPFKEMFHPPAFSSQKLAKSLHITGRRVVKSVLLKGPTGFLLAVLPASQWVDLPGLIDLMAGPVRLATVDELCALFNDCEFGALMPFGRLYNIRTILDANIPLDATIVFEAQQHAVAIGMTCRDFVRLESPERIPFACDNYY
ncbi:MAG: YbaK/EbsC family protein [Gemmataceae bacterium]|nr:YbaK/EbsC family protein [Gemmataceae bacterium]